MTKEEEIREVINSSFHFIVPEWMIQEAIKHYQITGQDPIPYIKEAARI